MSSLEAPSQFKQRMTAALFLLLHSTMLGIAARPLAVGTRFVAATDGAHHVQTTVLLAMAIARGKQALSAVIYLATGVADADPIHHTCRQPPYP